MLDKEIIGFDKKIENKDNICPNCNNQTLNIPVGIILNEGFLGLKSTRKIEYKCDKCGCIWRK